MFPWQRIGDTRWNESKYSRWNVSTVSRVGDKWKYDVTMIFSQERWVVHIIPRRSHGRIWENVAFYTFTESMDTFFHAESKENITERWFPFINDQWDIFFWRRVEEECGMTRPVELSGESKSILIRGEHERKYDATGKSSHKIHVEHNFRGNRDEKYVEMTGFTLPSWCS